MKSIFFVAVVVAVVVVDGQVMAMIFDAVADVVQELGKGDGIVTFDVDNDDLIGIEVIVEEEAVVVVIFLEDDRVIVVVSAVVAVSVELLLLDGSYLILFWLS